QIESGIAGVSEERLRRLAAHYACDDEALIAGLVAMATERKRGWWEKYRGSLPHAFLDLAELEHHAGVQWDVDFLHIAGLLQTEDYSRALFSYVNP
ncbi:transcriptional regulator, partial [Streptomyces daliensis]|nr:transcriptional regulator [Streptomyces daliensis]